MVDAMTPAENAELSADWLARPLRPRTSRALTSIAAIRGLRGSAMFYSFMRPFVLLTILGCVGTDPSKLGEGTPLVGRWGGDHIALVLTDSVGSVE